MSGTVSAAPATSRREPCRTSPSASAAGPTMYPGQSTSESTGTPKASHNCRNRAALSAAPAVMAPAMTMVLLAIMPTGLPSMRPKAVTISGHEVPVDNLVVSGRRGELELVFSARGGEVDGALFDQKNLPTRGSVLLVPDRNDPGPPELFPRVSADSKGKFTLRGIRPGSYRMVALESVALNDQITEPDFLRTVAGRGDLISIEESGKYAVALHLEGER